MTYWSGRALPHHFRLRILLVRPVSILAAEVLFSFSMGKDGVNDSPTLEPTLVDESLIDAMLTLSPEERLRQNDRMVRTVFLLRQGWTATNATMKAARDGREP